MRVFWLIRQEDGSTVAGQRRNLTGLAHTWHALVDRTLVDGVRSRRGAASLTSHGTSEGQLDSTDNLRRMTPAQAEIGIFGGSGFYEFLEHAVEVDVETPYGGPSATAMVGRVEDRSIAFLPRHGRDHELPPHRINYAANAWAMKELGVSRVIGPCAAGSLKAELQPGRFAVCDQLVDRTTGRKDTLYDGPEVRHFSFADPYCRELRPLAVTAARDHGITVHDGGTVVVVPGPRFSTRAESRWFQEQGWDVINMTQYPEAYLARELGMCYVNISLITDHDVGLDETSTPVTAAEVFAVMETNNDALQGVLRTLIAAIPNERSCGCAGDLA